MNLKIKWNSLTPPPPAPPLFVTILVKPNVNSSKYSLIFADYDIIPQFEGTSLTTNIALFFYFNLNFNPYQIRVKYETTMYLVCVAAYEVTKNEEFHNLSINFIASNVQQGYYVSWGPELV